MLMPKKVKYRKQQRGRMKGKAWTGSQVSFGDYGLKAIECGWVTDRQIEAGRIAITRFIKRNGRIWIRMFPDKPVTKKPQETRMGKGKGAPEFWVAVIKPGPHPLRDGGRARDRGARGPAPGRPQARHQDQVREAGGGVSVKAEKVRELSVGGSQGEGEGAAGAALPASRSRSRSASSTTPSRSGTPAATSPGSRRCCRRSEVAAAA